jgi:hypothetical protein
MRSPHGMSKAHPMETPSITNVIKAKNPSGVLIERIIFFLPLGPRGGMSVIVNLSSPPGVLPYRGEGCVIEAMIIIPKMNAIKMKMTIVLISMFSISALLLWVPFSHIFAFGAQRIPYASKWIAFADSYGKRRLLVERF